ncbi:MAG: LPS export ABC transporter periplasmic protein LptC [Methylococcaceae bacterium]|jgi:lipopolysaccharide export system protein LptC
MFKIDKIYVILLVVALGTWWLVKFTGLDEVFFTPALKHSPDYYSTGYTKFEMDLTGKLDNKLLADKMAHYSDDGETHLDNLLIYFYNDKTPPWEIKSETGLLSADGKDLLLNGKVKVYRERSEHANQLIINTTNVKVKTETSYAETDDWAELLSQSNKTTGIGMKLVFTTPVRIDLLAKVRGTYETKK